MKLSENIFEDILVNISPNLSLKEQPTDAGYSVNTNLHK
jgi:hypothetical protein